ncbi:unknown [Parasutterella excrementihominis CAG:233]|nr:unknown [Parasutterella excrementihominis CAG:233]
MVIDGNDQEKTVSDIFTAQLPIVSDAMRVVLNRFAVCGRNNDDGNLRTVLLLKAGKLGFKRTFLFGRQKVCRIGDISHFRYRKQIRCRYGTEQCAQPKEERTDEKAETIKVWPEL